MIERLNASSHRPQALAALVEAVHVHPARTLHGNATDMETTWRERVSLLLNASSHHHDDTAMERTWRERVSR